MRMEHLGGRYDTLQFAKEGQAVLRDEFSELVQRGRISENRLRLVLVHFFKGCRHCCICETKPIEPVLIPPIVVKPMFPVSVCF